jgi:hypothetical protein
MRPMEPTRVRRLRKDGSWARLEVATVRDVRSRACAAPVAPLLPSCCACAPNPHCCGAARRQRVRLQGTLLYTCGRDVGALDAAEALVKDLLLSSSFDLRVRAQTISAAAALLCGLPAVAQDSEAAFFAEAINSSCNLLLGA